VITTPPGTARSVARRRDGAPASQLLSSGVDRLAAAVVDVRFMTPREPTGETPRVSVVVPCYNYGHYLPVCLGSVLSQEGVRVEAIIVDDASPDGSGDVAVELSRTDSRIRVVRHEVNEGHIATYNDGLARATGDYVALVSADDLLTPGALRRATGLMEHIPSVGFTYGRVRPFSGAPPRCADKPPTGWIVWDGRKWLAQRWRSGRNCIWSPEVVMRTSVQRAIGGYRANLPHTADLDMWMRAASLSDVGFLTGVEQAAYRWHPANMHASTFSGRDAEGIIVDLRERLRTFDTYEGGLPPGVDRSAARRALSREALRTASQPRARGLPDATVMARLRAFARDVDPSAPTSRCWRVSERRMRTAERGVPTASATFGLLELAGRVDGRIRRWPWDRVGA
jgi:GT2 family glycosyltransferase